MTRRPGLAGALATATALLVVTGCTGDSAEEPAATAATAASVAPVDLGGGEDAESSVSEVTLGVVVTLGSDPGQGEAWKFAAEGATVAAYRYSRGEVDVTLEVRDDSGSTEGAVAAVRELVDAGVTGIVVASSGDHLEQALAVAQDEQVPVVLPYEPVPENLLDGGGLFSLAPSEEVAGATLATALEDREAELPYVLDIGGGVPEGLEDYAERTVTLGEQEDRLFGLVRRSIRQDGVDAILLSGPAEAQAQLLVSLQGTRIDLPVFLTPDALAPAFSTTLTDADAPLSEDLTTVGADNGDIGAMAAGARGAALSAFFAALRAAVDDPEVSTFFDDQPFRAVAEDVDTRSHDAVVVLVEAARRADDTGAEAVLATLDGLRLDDTDGLAGPAVDLGSPQIVPPSAVVPLQSTVDDPGLRPIDPESPPRLHWFTAISDDQD
ncbi:ABC transporter substrate-binding protein [Nocardioidaceae bacterium]|nr:ABC transporter substrate-binding protein [Nocardioidaceae bacterium]